MAEPPHRDRDRDRDRDGAPGSLRLPGVPVTFEEVAVEFSREEWDGLEEGQRELCRGVLEENYEMLVSLYCALSKPELLLRMERGEELLEPDLEGAAVSPGPPLGDPTSPEPGCGSCSSHRLLERKTREPCAGNCREDEEEEEEEDEDEEEEDEEEEEEEGRPWVVPVQGSAPGWSAEPAEAEAPGADAASPSTTTPPGEGLVPPAATTLPAAPSPPSPAPSWTLSMCHHVELDWNWSPSPPPAAAGDAEELGIPMEVLEEEVTVERPPVPEMPSERGKEEEEEVKDSGNGAQDLVADVPKEPGKKGIQGACRAVGDGEQPMEGPPMDQAAPCQPNSPEEKYSCSVCRKNFLLEINFVIHQRGHGTRVPCGCTHCNHPLVSKRKICHHVQVRVAEGSCPPVGKEEEEEEGGEHSSRWAPCPPSQPQTSVGNCGKGWRKRFGSRGHLVPLPEVVFQCKGCSQNFSSLDFLVLHKQLCPGCETTTFPWASPSPRHPQAQPGQRPYQCGICQRTFRLHSHLTSHQRAHR